MESGRRGRLWSSCDLGGGGDLARLEDGAERRHERGAVDVRRQEAQRDAVLDEALDVSAHQVDDGARELARVEGGDLGAQTKVDEHEAAIPVDQEVARVRV